MYLLDACVYSEFTRPTPSETVLAWARSVREADHFLSVLVLGELLRGAAKLPDGVRRSSLEHWIETLFVTHRSRIVPVETDVVRVWASLCSTVERAGRPAAAIDSLLAAQAKAKGLTLVTRNTADFDSFGISVLNPWEAGA